MSGKLTLSIDEKVIEEAKSFAKENGKSLSKIIEGYLQGLKRKKVAVKHEDLSPILKRLHGCIKDDGSNYKAAYRESVIEKYNSL